MLWHRDADDIFGHIKIIMPLGRVNKYNGMFSCLSRKNCHRLQFLRDQKFVKTLKIKVVILKQINLDFQTKQLEINFQKISLIMRVEAMIYYLLIRIIVIIREVEYLERAIKGT